MKVNFEKLFQSKFKDYKVQPDQEIWKNIDKKINGTRKTSNIVKYTVIATILSIAVVLGLKNTNTKNNISQPENTTYTIENSRIPTENANTQLSDNQDNTNSHFRQHKNQIIVAYSDTYQIDLTDETTENEVADTEPQEQQKTYKGFKLSENSGCCPLQLIVQNLDKSENITWTINGKTFSKQEEFSVTLDNPGEYEIQLTHNNAPKNIFKKTVVVYAAPKAEFTTPDEILTSKEVIFENVSENAEEFEWLINGEKISDNKNLIHEFYEAGSYKVTLVAYSKKCSDTLEKQIEVQEQTVDILFPTAFSASTYGSNGGYYSTTNNYDNSVFHPYLFGRNVKDYKLTIYDKKGNLIFSSNDINIGWDGYVKGKLAPIDVYIYVAKGTFEDGTPFVKQGSVTLIY